MHDLKKIAEECIRELKAINIPLQDNKIINIKTADLRDCMGICHGKRNKNGYIFSIKIKKELLQDFVDTKDLKEVIAHELLHTCPRCLGHGKTWRKYAKILNQEYGYSLLEEKDDDAIFHKEKPVIHRVVCPVCGALYDCRDIRAWEDSEKSGGFVCSFCGSDYQTVF